MSIAYLNGQFLPIAEARISVLDRGFLFAEGVYEVTAVIDGRLVDSASHLARLQRSADAIGLSLPLDGAQVSVSSLCIASAVPPTTALRWIRTLTDKGFVHRQADPHDGRRVFIALTEETADALTRWFTASRRFLCG